MTANLVSFLRPPRPLSDAVCMVVSISALVLGRCIFVGCSVAYVARPRECSMCA